MKIATGAYTHLESKNLGISKTLTNEYYAQRAKEAQERRQKARGPKKVGGPAPKMTDAQVAHSRWLYEHAGASVEWIADAMKWTSLSYCKSVLVYIQSRSNIDARRVDGMPVPQNGL